MVNLPVDVNLNLAAFKALDMLLDNATLHPKVEKNLNITDVSTMSKEQLEKEAENLLDKLKDFPNIIVLRDLLWRFKYGFK